MTSISAYLRIELDDVLAEISDEQLLQELKDRRKAPLEMATEPDLVLLSYEALKNGDEAEAALLLERHLFPRWKTPDACREAYAKMVRS